MKVVRQSTVCFFQCNVSGGYIRILQYSIFDRVMDVADYSIAAMTVWLSCTE